MNQDIDKAALEKAREAYEFITGKKIVSMELSIAITAYESARVPAPVEGSKGDEWETMAAWAHKQLMKRYQELRRQMPGDGGLYAEGHDDGSFVIAYHSIDANDDGRPTDYGGSVIEGDAVTDEHKAALIGEYLTLAVQIAEDAARDDRAPRPAPPESRKP